jgi:hypothetical protein
MKKVIRLSENDLVNIVKRIINEQDGEAIPYSTDIYKTQPKATGKYTFQEVTQEMLPKYLKWYEGSTYPEIQEYITKTYGIPRLFDPKSLETQGKTNSSYNLFREFLNAVQASLIVAAKLNYNGNLFTRDYDFRELNNNMGNRFVTKDWISTFEENLPMVGKLPEFKKFIGKVITARRKAIGLKN